MWQHTCNGFSQMSLRSGARHCSRLARTLLYSSQLRSSANPDSDPREWPICIFPFPSDLRISKYGLSAFLQKLFSNLPECECPITKTGYLLVSIHRSFFVSSILQSYIRYIPREMMVISRLVLVYIYLYVSKHRLFQLPIQIIGLSIAVQKSLDGGASF